MNLSMHLELILESKGNEEFSWEFSLLIDGVIVTIWVTDVFI